ncbi:CPBP family intramembrane glutamic endopeptidase [Microbulbifer aggregans]|uniref:CPBP family intramembrane glutamic endopeptidase n=1 Tax=Microbulbifer aggregans TaxID=1769779 RepID=UPI001CFEC898|nr:CPBP family intramembrane glutamic endopeptidase [Microbulbifer aggregans]
MGQSNSNTASAFGMGLAIQGVSLAIAMACLYFSRVDVSWFGSEQGMLGQGYMPQVLTGVLGALLTYITCAALTRSKTRVGVKLREHCKAFHPFFRDFSWGQIGLLAVAAGVCEELLFRGFFQPWMTSFSLPVLGILGASVLFGLLHYASFIYFFLTFAIGLTLGVVYWLSESLLTVIVWHGVYDLIAIGVLAKYPHWLGVSSASQQQAMPQDL